MQINNPWYNEHCTYKSMGYTCPEMATWRIDENEQVQACDNHLTLVLNQYMGTNQRWQVLIDRLVHFNPIEK